MASAFAHEIKNLTRAIEAQRPEEALPPDAPAEARAEDDLRRRLADFFVVDTSALAAKDGARTFAETWVATRQAHAFFESLRELAALRQPAPPALDALADDVIALGETPELASWTSTARGALRLAVIFDYVAHNDLSLTGARRQTLSRASERLVATLGRVFPDFNAWAEATYRGLRYFDLDPYQRRITVEKWAGLCRAQADSRVLTVAIKGIADCFKAAFLPRLQALSRPQQWIVHTLAKAKTQLSFASLLREMGVSGARDVEAAGSDQGAVFAHALQGLVARGAVCEKDEGYALGGGEFTRWYPIAAKLADAPVSKYASRPAPSKRHDVA